ncbi:hypothetical protein GN956_G17446 [Arapaima gigas]
MSEGWTTEADSSLPPYTISVAEAVKVYHLHPPFSTSRLSRDTSNNAELPPVATPAKKKFVSYETEVGRSPAVIHCPFCQQQVMTNVTYKIGAFAWLMCFVFILCGLVVGCCLIPFFVKYFKDVYHSCPRCQQILHIERKSCC